MNLRERYLAALKAAEEALAANDLETARTKQTEAAALRVELETEQASETLKREVAANQKWANELRPIQFDAPTPSPVETPTPAKPREYATPAPYTTSFLGNTASEKAERAFRFGQFFSAAIAKNPKAQQWCREHGVELSMSGDSATAGASMVPIEFRADMQVLLERYSGLRQCCTPWPMTSDTQQVPRTTGGLTVYSPGQAQAIGTSDPTQDMITLKADTFLTLTYIAKELVADSPIAIGNYLFDLIAQAFGAAEDDMFINGDGTSTYWGRVGLAAAFRQMDPSWNSTTLTNVANIAGAYVQSNKAFASQVVADLSGVDGLLPAYADNPNTRWLCSRAYRTGVMERLAYAQGAAAAAALTDAVTPRFMGFPIVVSQKAPRLPAGAIDAAANGIPVFLGDFTQGTAFGDRQEYTIDTDSSVGFASNTIAIRGSMRIDIVNHGVGNYSATAASRQPGPIVCGIGPHT